MRTISTLLLLLLVSSCGLPFGQDFVKKSGKRQFSTTDPAFNIYIQRFEQDAAKEYGIESYSIGDIPINFGDPENAEYAGVCHDRSGLKEVIIRKSWWDQASDESRETMIFHELGHCSLGRGHNDKEIPIELGNNKSTTFKISIMNREIPEGGIYVSYKTGYHDELFHQNESTLYNQLKAMESKF